MSKRKCDQGESMTTKKKTKTPYNSMKPMADEIIEYSRLIMTPFQPEKIKSKDSWSYHFRIVPKYFDPQQECYIGKDEFDAKYRCRHCNKCFREGLEKMPFLTWESRDNVYNKSICPACVQIGINLFIESMGNPLSKAMKSSSTHK